MKENLGPYIHFVILNLTFSAISVIAAKLAGVKRKFLVLSGKGGVGKSTVSTLLSRAFATKNELNVSIDF